jgi:hypothetical protein
MLFALVRGPFASDFYPYPFSDAEDLGYLRVSINAVWIGLLFVNERNRNKTFYRLVQAARGGLRRSGAL